MATIPVTSISLLETISKDTESSRWVEFYKRYKEPICAFLREDRFRGVEPEEVIQRVLLTLTKALPKFLMTEDKRGHFRNYLMGIVKHKALDIIRSEERRRVRHHEATKLAENDYKREADYKEWQYSLVEVAISALLKDETINPRTREVFRQLVENHESPEKVAEKFGLTRNNVDQIKSRMIEKLKKTISLMSA